MLYIPKTNEEVKDFVAINLSKYFKSTREGQYLRKVAKLLYIFLTTSDEVEKYMQSDSSDNAYITIMLRF